MPNTTKMDIPPLMGTLQGGGQHGGGGGGGGG